MPKSNNKSNKSVQKSNKRKNVTAVSKTQTKKVKKVKVKVAPKVVTLMYPDVKLPRAPFLRLVKAIAKKENPEARIQANTTIPAPRSETPVARGTL